MPRTHSADCGHRLRSRSGAAQSRERQQKSACTEYQYSGRAYKPRLFQQLPGCLPGQMSSHKRRRRGPSTVPNAGNGPSKTCKTLAAKSAGCQRSIKSRPGTPGEAFSADP